jgi:hypothetical protein
VVTAFRTSDFDLSRTDNVVLRQTMSQCRHTVAFLINKIARQVLMHNLFQSHVEIDCFNDVAAWMMSNRLQLNADNSELHDLGHDPTTQTSTSGRRRWGTQSTYSLFSAKLRRVRRLCMIYACVDTLTTSSPRGALPCILR